MSEPMPTEGGLNEADFSALMDSVSTMAPLLRGILGSSKGDGEGKGKCSRREALLLALKPYLSSERCDMIEYLIRMSRISDLLRSLQ